MMSTAYRLLTATAAMMQEARTAISMIDTAPRRGAIENDMACTPRTAGTRSRDHHSLIPTIAAPRWPSNPFGRKIITSKKTRK